MCKRVCASFRSSFEGSTLSSNKPDKHQPHTYKHRPWDVAAGIVLVKEAGGELRAIDGGDFVFETGRGTLVCGNKAIVEGVVECVRKADKKMWKRVAMVQVKGWSGIGLMMLSALVGALLLGGKKGPRTS